MGGEKPSVMEMLSDLMGSPPRRRGKDAVQRHATCGVGITPAWAGKSPRYDRTQSEYRDHPRMGGEKLLAMKSRATFWGSPPRRRGKVWVKPVIGRRRGITPAWAGKRRDRQRQGSPLWDHPRVGGEKITSSCVPASRSGSPPRGRGKELRLVDHGLQHRITPAWAGKSFAVSSSARCARDHPRMGGEKNNGSCDLSIV